MVFCATAAALLARTLSMAPQAGICAVVINFVGTLVYYTTRGWKTFPGHGTPPPAPRPPAVRYTLLTT